MLLISGHIYNDRIANALAELARATNCVLAFGMRYTRQISKSTRKSQSRPLNIRLLTRDLPSPKKTAYLIAHHRRRARSRKERTPLRGISRTDGRRAAEAASGRGDLCVCSRDARHAAFPTWGVMRRKQTRPRWWRRRWWWDAILVKFCRKHLQFTQLALPKLGQAPINLVRARATRRDAPRRSHINSAPVRGVSLSRVIRFFGRFRVSLGLGKAFWESIQSFSLDDDVNIITIIKTSSYGNCPERASLGALGAQRQKFDATSENNANNLYQFLGTPISIYSDIYPRYSLRYFTRARYITIATRPADLFQRKISLSRSIRAYSPDIKSKTLTTFAKSENAR